MKSSLHCFTLSQLSLTLLLLAANAAQAVTESNQGTDNNPAVTATIKAAPNAEQTHILKVQLDQKGDWSVVPSSTVKMRFQYTHQWSQQPNPGAWARIYVGETEDQFAKAQMFDLNSAKVLAASGYQIANMPFNLLVGDGIPGADIATYCSFEKSNRLKQGKTLNQVLRQGFNVKLNVPLKMAGFYELGGGPNTSRPASNHQYHIWNNTAPVTIQCLGNPAIADKVAPPKGPEGLAAPFSVSSVELVALQHKLTTVCPAEITLKATIKGVGGGDFKYWLEEIGGQGAAVQLTSNLPGKVGEQSIRVLQQKVSIKPGSPVINQQGIGGIKANTPGGTLVKRSYRFNVLAPNKVQSTKVDVEVTCTSTLNVEPGGQNSLQMAPVKPQPPVPGLKLKAADPVPPMPNMPIKAPVPAPEPPKPNLQIKAAEPQPPKPELPLQSE